MSTPTPTHVYIVGYSDNVVKVGRTSAPAKRIRELSSEGRRRGAHITHQWMKPANDAPLAEYMLRELGRTTLTKAWGDEYFRCDDAARFIEDSAQTLTRWLGENFHDETYAIVRDADPMEALSRLFSDSKVSF